MDQVRATKPYDGPVTVGAKLSSQSSRAVIVKFDVPGQHFGKLFGDVLHGNLSNDTRQAKLKGLETKWVFPLLSMLPTHMLTNVGGEEELKIDAVDTDTTDTALYVTLKLDTPGLASAFYKAMVAWMEAKKEQEA